MQSPSTDVGNAFGRSWQLLTSNWIIIVPGLIVGLLAGIVLAFFTPSNSVTVDSSGVINAGSVGVLGSLVTSIVSIIATVLTIAYTTGMAGAAWATGRATLADGAEAFRREGTHVFVAMVGLFVVGIVAAFLAPFTLGISLLAFLVFFLYTMPAAVVGDRPGFTAMAESTQIALKRFAATIITVLIIAVIAVLGAMIAGALSFAPFIGPVVAAVIQQIVLAYFTLVIVGEYLAFRGDLVVPPSAGSPPVAPP